MRKVVLKKQNMLRGLQVGKTMLTSLHRELNFFYSDILSNILRISLGYLCQVHNFINNDNLSFEGEELLTFRCRLLNILSYSQLTFTLSAKMVNCVFSLSLFS